MIFTVLDFEADSLDTTTANILEVGALSFDENFNFLEGISELCYDETDPPVPDEIVEITGITTDMLKADGKPRKEVIENLLLPLLGKSDCVFIHNASYDHKLLEATCNRLGLFMRNFEVVCTLTNFEYPKEFKNLKLKYLWFDHMVKAKAKIDFASFNAHRAFFDCQMLTNILSKYDMEKARAYAREPWVIVKAECRPPWTDTGPVKQVDIAKRLGFRWEKLQVGYELIEVPKTWLTRVKASQLEALKESIFNSEQPFRIFGWE